MDKTVKINLAGLLFQIDEKAFYELKDYLKAIENNLQDVPGGNETLNDIEARIAEIFQSSKNGTGIISSEDVEAVKQIIGKPEEFQPSDDTGVKKTRNLYRRRLYRDKTNSVLGGVCNGIGAYLNIDPVWIRVIFLIFTFAYAAGLLVYLVLWIALPVAVTEIQKRELYGENYYSRFQTGSGTHSDEFTGALNSIFAATGTILKIFFRVIVAGAGVLMVILGFTMLLSFILIFYVKYPFSFLTGGDHSAVFSIHEFLNLITEPPLTLLIMILLSVAVILPLAAVIFWGLKMIIRFRTNAMWLSIISLIVWVLSCTALVIILFSHGISFAEKGRFTEKISIPGKPDTLYIKTEKKIYNLKYDRELMVPGTNYSVFLAGQEGRLFARPVLGISSSAEGKISFSVEKIMFGSSYREANKKAESLSFGYRYSGDTLYIDQYFEIPGKYKWSGAFINAELCLPENIMVWIDEDAEILIERCFIPDKRQKNNFLYWNGFELIIPD